MNMHRPIWIDPLVWAYIILLTAILCVTLTLLNDSMRTRREILRVQAQNRRLVDENDARWRENQKSMGDRDNIHGELQETRATLKRLDDRSEYLDALVKKLERDAEERRKKSQMKPQPKSSLNAMPSQMTTLTVTRVVADELAKRPDFVSRQPTYGPEGLYIVVLRGNPDLTTRRDP